MLTLERVALELLEYKIDALAARRNLRGGIPALWELHRAVERGMATLDPEERQRFAEAARRLRALAEIPTRGSGRRAELATLMLGGAASSNGEVVLETEQVSAPAPSREMREEQRALLRLAERVGREDLDDVIARLAAAWRAERDRLTPRLVYATLRNLQRFVESGDTRHDASLRGFRVVEAIPDRHDPLISLSDLDSLGEVGRDLVDVILNLGGPESRYPRLEVAEAQALGFVKQVAMFVAQDPYAGKLSSLPRKGPSTEGLRLAIQELAKERLPEAQRSILRGELEARLSEAVAFERQQRQAFQRDGARNVEVVRALFERLEPHLPARLGGSAPATQLAGGVLFAVSPFQRWERVPHGAEALTLRLVGPVRFTLGGHAVAVMGTGDSRTLFVDDDPHPLADKMVVRVGRGKIHADREGEYLHVRWRDGARSVAVRLAAALVASHVLTHERHASLLEVLGAIAGTSGGAPEDVVAKALQRAATVTEQAPNRRTALEGLVRGAAKATGSDLEDNVVLGLVQRLQTATSAEPGDLATLLEREELADGASYTVGDDPVTADLGPLKLTLRRYRARGRDATEQLVVMLPGQVVGAFNTTAVESVPGGVLVCAQGDGEVAVLFLRERTLRAKLVR